MKEDMNVKINEDCDMYKHIKKLAEDGYTTEDGKPLKCINCEATDLEDVITDTMEYGVCEYKVVCKSCGETTGYWAYGYWQV